MLHIGMQVLLGLGMLLLAKRMFGKVTPFSSRVQRLEKDNPAMALVLCGYLFGMMAVTYGSLSTPFSGALGLPMLISWLMLALRTAIGMLLLLLAGWLNNLTILNHVKYAEEITGRRNISVAAVLGASFGASGLIIGAAFQGDLPILPTIIFCMLGQGYLLLLGALLPDLIGYRKRKWWVEDQNLAMGVALGGHLLAGGLIIKGSMIRIIKPFQIHGGTSMHDIASFAGFALAGGAALLVVRLINNRAFIRRLKLSDEIQQGRYLNAGLYESVVIILAAGVIHTIMDAYC